MIPFLDIQEMNMRFSNDFEKAFKDFLKNGYCILGKNLATFESEFAQYCGTKYCVGVANGLDAITLILKGYILLGKLQKGFLCDYALFALI